ncbi:hypothetical protein THAOC_31559, partial [Thalassiosira oceanica]
MDVPSAPTEAPAASPAPSAADATGAPTTVTGPRGTETEAPTTETRAPTLAATEPPTTETRAPAGPGTEAPTSETQAPTGPATEAPTTETRAPIGAATEAPTTETRTPTGEATEAPTTETRAPTGPVTEAPTTETRAPTEPATEAPTTDADADESDGDCSDDPDYVVLSDAGEPIGKCAEYLATGRPAVLENRCRREQPGGLLVRDYCRLSCSNCDGGTHDGDTGSDGRGDGGAHDRDTGANWTGDGGAYNRDTGANWTGDGGAYDRDSGANWTGDGGAYNRDSGADCTRDGGAHDGDKGANWTGDGGAYDRDSGANGRGDGGAHDGDSGSNWTIDGGAYDGDTGADDVDSIQTTETSSPTPATSSLTVDTSTLLEGLELDLFGLISLNPSERAAFEERTAAYIADFYGGDGEDPTLDALDDLFELDGDLGTDSVGPGDGVRVLSASVTVTDQTLPLGDTFGIDCDDIDPLVAAFTLEFVYESDDPDATAGEVAARPFSTDEFRRTYIDDFLKRDDGGGGTSFFDLLCVSELRLPPGEGGTTPAPTAADASPHGHPHDHGRAFGCAERVHRRHIRHWEAVRVRALLPPGAKGALLQQGKWTGTGGVRGHIRLRRGDVDGIEAVHRRHRGRRAGLRGNERASLRGRRRQSTAAEEWQAAGRSRRPRGSRA